MAVGQLAMQARLRVQEPGCREIGGYIEPKPYHWRIADSTAW